MRRKTSILAGIALITALTGCGGGRSEHYSSPVAQGDSRRINLEAVQEAFWQTKGNDFDAWMASFEKQVNEIYQGDEIVSIDAGREGNRLTVTGFIDKDKKQGYQSDDDKLFAVAQTGDLNNGQMPYRMEGSQGQPYYQGSHSILDNPLIQMFVLSSIMRPHYYTPPARVIVLDRGRELFRRTPQYQTQKMKNRSFFKTKADGFFKSNKGFSKGSLWGGEGVRKRRSWFGSGSSDSGSSWGGRRRSSSSWGGSKSSSGWGRRRR